MIENQIFIELTQAYGFQCEILLQNRIRNFLIPESVWGYLGFSYLLSQARDASQPCHKNVTILF